MSYSLDAAGQVRLDRYFDGIGSVLRRRDRRESFALYAIGLFGDSERKSVEPIAARACADPDRCNAYHDRLLHFLGVAQWSDAEVRQYAVGYGISSMAGREPVTDWIIDDTGFPKQGDKSPRVQRPVQRDAWQDGELPGRRVGDGRDKHDAPAARHGPVSAQELG
jgi:SRSO17 transposase